MDETKCSVFKLVSFEEALVHQSPVYESVVKAFERKPMRHPVCRQVYTSSITDGYSLE